MTIPNDGKTQAEADLFLLEIHPIKLNRNERLIIRVGAYNNSNQLEIMLI